MTSEIYELWREAWLLERPGRIPPTIEQVNQLMTMFDIPLSEIFGIETGEVSFFGIETGEIS